MAEKAKEKKEEAPAGDKPKKAPIWTKLPVLLGGVMVLEAVVLIGVFKVMGGGTPQTAHADASLKGGEGGHGDGHGGDGHGGGTTKAAGKVAELEVTTFRAPNVQSGRRLIYDVAIFVSVKKDNEEKVKAILKDRKATIEDRVRTIIAQADPEKLGGGTEPGLETLRRQVKYQLDEIIGGSDSVLDEVLIPRCIPFRGD